MIRKRRLVLLIFIAVVAAAAIVLGCLLYFGMLQLNRPSEEQYPVRGVDVSAYQGEIDWPTLSKQGVHFAFIKATEGSSHVDARFARNWEQAQKTSLRIGAYHFFSFDSAGQTQAENFIKTVPQTEGMLPPVVDLELYGEKKKNPPDKDRVLPELETMLALLEEAYGRKPILYTTAKSYRLYLAEGFAEYDIWIRDVLRKPKLPDGRAWTFWQYTDRARLEGYQGEERYIDLNVFCGTEAEFEAYGK